PGAVADARPTLRDRLVPVERGEEVVRPGALGHDLPPADVALVAHSTCLRPRRGGQRMISLRSGVRMTVCVNWLIPTYSAKNRSSTAPSRKTPEPSNALSSIVTVTSSPRAAATPFSARTRRVTGRLSTE